MPSTGNRKITNVPSISPATYTMIYAHECMSIEVHLHVPLLTGPPAFESYSWEWRSGATPAVHVIRRIWYTNALLRSFLRDCDWYVTGT